MKNSLILTTLFAATQVLAEDSKVDLKKYDVLSCTARILQGQGNEAEVQEDIGFAVVDTLRDVENRPLAEKKIEISNTDKVITLKVTRAFPLSCKAFTGNSNCYSFTTLISKKGKKEGELVHENVRTTLYAEGSSVAELSSSFFDAENGIAQLKTDIKCKYYHQTK